MKKRFTLMMMVLCILMSIPLQMMAFDEVFVNSDYNGGNWNGGYNSNFKFTTNDGIIYTCTLNDVPSGTNAIWFRIVKGGKEYGPKSDASQDLLLTGSYQQIYEGKAKALQMNITPGKTSYTITYDSEKKQIMYDAPESGGTTGSGTEGGGGSATDDTWAETENRLKGRVYTQGYYLAGNFFSFSGEKVTYDDAVFKFQQQKNDTEGNAVYMVEIPASLTAHAQVMSVNELGKAVKVYGPGSAYGISYTSPTTIEAIKTGQLKLAGSDPETFNEGTNYWNIVSRNHSEREYSDGMYKVFITVDKNTGEPSKWEFKHIGNTRVAFFISDAKNATAMPLYDTYKKDPKQFSNKFFASVNLSTGHSYYVISNYVVGKNESDGYIAYTKTKYGTLSPNGDAVTCPTTNKLFLLGNGGYAFDTNHNEFSPNEGPMKPTSTQQGSTIVEYNPSKCDNDKAKTDKHLGIRGEVIIKDTRVKLTSVSMVGDAIPGTLKTDGSWDYASTAADMTYDETEKCYKVTLVTTVADDGKSKFRFVGNHNKNINWYEDSDTDNNKKAKVGYTGNGEGHAATSYDPNKVNYTPDGSNSDKKWDIIWNRPAGRWTVRLYFYTYNIDNGHGDNVPVTDYYYTISENRELELRDCVNIVYKSEDTKRVIKNVGEYRFLRTWSDEKAWKVSKDIDIYVVDQLSAENKVVTLHLKQLDSKDNSGNYNVIPANIGVILGTKKEAADIAGGAVFHKRTSLTSLNTVVVPMYEYNANEETAGTSVTSKLRPLTYARVVPTSEIVDGKVTYNYLFGAGKGISVGITGCADNEFFMGFWISNGKGNFYSNSCCLSIDEETANILGVGIRNNQFDPTTNAKRVPGVIFDFANVGGTTGINEVVNQSTKLNDGKYYTLSGQQVEKPTAGGIYIHNGRKFVVK